MRKVEVVSANENWLSQFQQEKQLLTAIFQKELSAIHHIGSTAIHGIKAKPVIDILVVVKEIKKVDLYNQAMQQLGYESLGENGISERRFFMKGQKERTHHVHVFQEGNPEIQRHLIFRDYLNSHWEKAQAYSCLKVELAAQFPTDIDAYIVGKAGFIQEVDREANIWYNQEKLQ